MIEANIKTIGVQALDSATAAEIKKASTEVQPQADGSKVAVLDFQSAKADIPSGISVLEEMHKSDTDFITYGSGEINLGAILPLAGGKFGSRKADSGTIFNLFGDSAKAGKGRKTLTAEEKNALEILDKLSSGRKARIKAFMLSGTKATAADMKSLGLIDKVEGEFVDKYEQARKDAKKKK